MEHVDYISTKIGVTSIYNNLAFFLNNQDLCKIVDKKVISELANLSKTLEFTELPMCDELVLPINLEHDNLLEEIRLKLSEVFVFIHSWGLQSEDTISDEMFNNLINKRYESYRLFFDNMLLFIRIKTTNPKVKFLAEKLTRDLIPINIYLTQFNGNLKENTFKVSDFTEIVTALFLFRFIGLN